MFNSPLTLDSTLGDALNEILPEDQEHDDQGKHDIGEGTPLTGIVDICDLSNTDKIAFFFAALYYDSSYRENVLINKLFFIYTIWMPEKQVNDINYTRKSIFIKHLDYDRRIKQPVQVS